jgi:hypothetical protein
MPEFYSEFDEHAGDKDWIDEGEQLYDEMVDQMIDDYGSEVMDQHAIDLLYSGWYDPDSNVYDRTLDRFEFFDYTGIEYEDFDWQDWRDWYES